jgi:hypothetical protein
MQISFNCGKCPAIVLARNWAVLMNHFRRSRGLFAAAKAEVKAETQKYHVRDDPFS